MKRIWIISLVCLGLGTAKADVVEDILIKKLYEPQSLSAQTADSVLNKANAQAENEAFYVGVANRYELKESGVRKMFRYSYWADYRLYDKAKKVEKIVGDSLRDVGFSPDGRYLAYGKGQDLWLYKLDYHTQVPITHEAADGRDVFSGLSDWLYEEEFGHTRLYWFSPDSKQIAFVRLDETDVPTFHWQTYLDEGLYPLTHSIRYPKSGCANARASVCVYDIFSKGIKTLELGSMQDGYIPNVVWRTLPGEKKGEVRYELVVEKINRDQTQMEVWAVNPKSGVGRLLYTEKATNAYMDYALFEQWQWLSDGRMIVLSEKDGWRALYLYSREGREEKRLTDLNSDVTAVYGVDEKNGLVYYQAAPVPAERQVYAASYKKGGVTQLSEGAGMHSWQISKDGKRVIARYESDTHAPQWTLYTLSGLKLSGGEVILSNKAVQTAWEQSGLPVKQWLKIPTERGDSLDAWMICPQPMQGQHPLVMMQYSGPASQRVLNRWRHRFAHCLAALGYVVINVDVRGSDCRGRAWRNQTYMDLGAKEAQDHLSVAKYMAKQDYVDADKIAMIGWSYGGYQTIRTLCEQDPKAPLIACGVAIAPVTDWNLYDTGYTERFMRRPQVNEQGYQAADLITKAGQLTGDLLLIHGTGDDNVHYQNTLRLMSALVQEGKQFDVQLYVDDNHSMRQAANYEHLHRRVLRFLAEKFGK